MGLIYAVYRIDVQSGTVTFISTFGKREDAMEAIKIYTGGIYEVKELYTPENPLRV